MPMFKWKNPSVKYIVALFVVIFLFLVYTNTKAGPVIGVAGGSTIGDPGINPAVELQVSDEKERWEGVVGYIDTDKNDVKYVAVDHKVYFVPGNKESPHVFLGVLLADTDETSYYLSQDFNFYLGVGAGYKNFRIDYKHISNAGMSEPNYGLNFVLASYRF